MVNKKISLIAVVCSSVFIFSHSFFFYPKWKQGGTEATISWDVSGYYWYLPATFIYKDIKQLKFNDDILTKYGPTPELQQAFKHESGNYVMKYSIGQAVQYLPAFAIAHLIATYSSYEADGFSRPYQLMISLGSLMVALIGLLFLRRNLLEYYTDAISAVTIIFIVAGTNYLNYSAIDGAMTHNYLFTIYSVLIYFTISFYKSPSLYKAAAIGFLIGLATITRPTEIISFTIPLLWGTSVLMKESIRNRFLFFKAHLPKVFIAILVSLLVGSIQVLYWKYVSGEWTVYSYQDQGFSWLHPHLVNGFFSYKSGWLVYTPIMIFALIGFVPLYFKKAGIFWALASFSFLFIYITFAWDVWWYGGSLGQRSMVQCYAILAFPFAAYINFIKSKRLLKYLTFVLFGIFSYYNIWLTYQAHGGSLLHVSQMTKAYFWKTVGRYKNNENDLKLLDTKEEYNGVRKNITLIYSNDFEGDSVVNDCGIAPIEGKNSICLHGENQNSPVYSVKLNPGTSEWVRTSATFRCISKEWDIWKMTQFIVRFHHNDKIIKSRMIRVYRILQDGATKELYIDATLPDETFDSLSVLFWNANSEKPIAIDNLRIEQFDEGN